MRLFPKLASYPDLCKGEGAPETLYPPPFSPERPARVRGRGRRAPTAAAGKGRVRSRRFRAGGDLSRRARRGISQPSEENPAIPVNTGA